MARNYKVAILRARHDRSADLISDTACAGVFIANGSGQSVFQYWQQVSLGFLTFNGSRMFPWVDIEIDAAVDEERDRFPLYRKARAATEAAGHDLGDFDAFLVMVHPGTAIANFVVIPRLGTGGPTVVDLDSGATSDGDTGVAVVRSDSDHTFMCHELGHTMAWEHTFGVWNHGTDWDKMPPFTLDREYGDPYDIMSSATFGGRWLDPDGPMYGGSPGFAGTVALGPGWPGDVPWRGMGPGPAQAHLHLYAPQALEAHGRVRHVDLPGPGQSLRIPLWAASSPLDGARTTLIAIHPPDEDPEGRGRYYIEYRDTRGWDRGLETTGDDLSRRAVVLHRLRDGKPGDLRCWYQGRIVVPLELDTDAGVARLPLSVRVVAVAPDRSWVTVELVRSSDRAVFIDRTDREEVVGFDVHRTDTVDTLCGTLTANWGAHRVVVCSTFTARSYGFGGAGTGLEARPVVGWTVAGQPVGASTGSISVAVGGRTVQLQVTVDEAAGLLSLASRPDDRQYEVDVVARVTEADGSGLTASAPARFFADGLQFGYDRSIQQQLRSCIEDVLDKLRIRPQEIFVRPVDSFRRRDSERIQRLKLTTLASRIRLTNPTLGSELQHLVALRYGAIPG
ncbi:MAG: hypothetical protein ACRD0A_19720 [Acidimicrobiales bacterium]